MGRRVAQLVSPSCRLYSWSGIAKCKMQIVNLDQAVVCRASRAVRTDCPMRRQPCQSEPRAAAIAPSTHKLSYLPRCKVSNHQSAFLILQFASLQFAIPPRRTGPARQARRYPHLRTVGLVPTDEMTDRLPTILKAFGLRRARPDGAHDLGQDRIMRSVGTSPTGADLLVHADVAVKSLSRRDKPDGDMGKDELAERDLSYGLAGGFAIQVPSGRRDLPTELRSRCSAPVRAAQL